MNRYVVVYLFTLPSNHNVFPESVNRASLERIIQSVFVLCLDKPHGRSSNDPIVGEDPRLTTSLNQMLHGGGTELNSCNRWFDKIFQVSCS